MSAQLYVQLDAARAFASLAYSPMSQAGAPKHPSLSALALLCEWAGVSGVSLSARVDELEDFSAHIKRLREELSISVNAQLSPELDVTRLAFELQPTRVTLIPPRWLGPSVVGGLDPFQLGDGLKAQVAQLHEADIEVAVRVAPKLDLIKRLQRFDIDVLQLSTHELMTSARGTAKRRHFKELTDAALLASRLGFKVAVTGALDLAAVEQLSRLSQLSELHVGHALLSRSMLRGVERAAHDFMEAIERGRQSPL